MISKELKDLIEALLAKGTITDNDKVALANRAAKEGVDLTELDNYINALVLEKRHSVQINEADKNFDQNIERSNEQDAANDEEEEAMSFSFIKKNKLPLMCTAVGIIAGAAIAMGILFFTGKSSSNTLATSETDSTLVAQEEAVAANTITDEEAETLITEMYENELYNDNAYLMENCTASLIEKLKADYEYDCLEGDCLAGWDFRSRLDDGPSMEHKLLKVTPLGDSWWQYDFIDMGNVASNKVHLVKENGEILFDDVKIVN